MPWRSMGGVLALALLAWRAPAQGLLPKRVGDRIQAAAPRLGFLSGRVLEMVRNGQAVPINLHFSLAEGPAPAPFRQRDIQRVIVSYDIWEERFSAVCATCAQPAQLSHATAESAEEWSTGRVSLPTSALAASQHFWLRLEVRAESRPEPMTNLPDPGLVLTRLIDLFSRPATAQQMRWVREAGPLRLMDLSP